MPPHNHQSDQVTEFDPDLYRGTARDYDRFRVAYPDVMIDGLLDAVGPSGRGRLLDLACGTGQITFALAERFAEVWAVDQEPDMIELVRAKAQAIPDTHVHAVAVRAEDLVAPANAFELVAIGNAFHRLRREAVAANSFRWLEPNRWIALLWSTGPWTGDTGWQAAMAAVVERWKTRLGAQARVPAGWEEPRRRRPDTNVLASAGFRDVRSARFPRSTTGRPTSSSGSCTRRRSCLASCSATRPRPSSATSASSSATAASFVRRLTSPTRSRADPHSTRPGTEASPFTAMDAAALRRRCLSLPGSTETFPFGPETSVFKVADKMFALSRLAGDPLQISLKCEPALADRLRDAHPAVRPGYHLNKRHWNTVTIDGSIADQLVEDMIEDSYDLVVSQLSQSRQRALGWLT